MKRQSAFALAEVIVGVAVFSIMAAAMFAGLSQSLCIVQAAREDLRATQILEEKMDTIRLYTWSQLNSSNFLPRTFSASFDPNSTNKQVIVFSGTISVNPISSLTESYKDQLREVSVSVSWNSGKGRRQREMTTYVSQHGLQNYIY